LSPSVAVGSLLVSAFETRPGEGIGVDQEPSVLPRPS
jgi:hypothetical protein